MSEWDERYLHAHESGSLLFPPAPTPTVVEALDHVTLASPRPSAIDVGRGRPSQLRASSPGFLGHRLGRQSGRRRQGPREGPPRCGGCQGP